MPSSSRSARPSSWWIPVGLLTLFLVTAGSFFIATKSKPSFPRRAAVEPIPEPTRGGLLRIPLLDAPLLTLDPVRAQSAPEIMVSQQIFDGLTALDEHLNVVPSLAQYWEISHDGKVYTFELRPDTVFHDGRRLSADDCVASFERLVKPELNTSNYGYFSRIEGAREYVDGLAKTVSGLRALDERTFQVRFSEPFVPALLVMSMYCSKILPQHALLEMGDEFFMTPIGTGPFRFSRWIDRDEDPSVPVYRGIPQALRLEANTRYFGRQPFLDAVVFRSLWNPADYLDGTSVVDRFHFLPQLSPNQPGWLPIEPQRLLSLHYLALPVRVPPFDKPLVRQAISYAIDKRRLIDASPLSAGAPVASAIVPPRIPGFFSDEGRRQHDLKKARRLLAEAGHPGGVGLPPLEILVYIKSESEDSLRARLKECLESVGIGLTEVTTTRYAIQDAPELAGRPLVQFAGWIADFPDPDNFLRPLFHSMSPLNLTGYQSREVDRLLDQAWSETSYSVRNRLYRQIEKMILMDMPVVPLHYGTTHDMVRPNVHGLSIPPMGLAYIKLNRVWLSTDETATRVGY